MSWLLTGDRIIKGLLGQMTSLVGRIEDLVVEDGEVESQTKTDGMSGREISGGHFSRGFVGFQ